MSEIKFGPPRDRMTQLNNGTWVMHTTRAIIRDGRVIGIAEFHLTSKVEDVGIICVTRMRPVRDGS